MLRLRGKYWHVKLWMDGRYKTASTRCTSKREALAVQTEIRKRYQERRRADTIARLLGEPLKRSKPLAIKDVATKYCKLYPDYSPSGMMIWQIFRAWLKSDLADISEVDVDTAVRFLNDKGKTSGKRHNNLKSALSQIWKRLKPYTDINRNIWLDIPNKPNDPESYKPFSNAELAALLDALKGDKDWYDAVMIGLYTGLRRKDVFTLRKDAVDIKAGIITTIPHKTSKNRKAVVIPIHAAILPVLRERLGHDKASPYVFPGRHDLYNAGAFVRRFQKALKECGITGKSFHGLRATFITRAEESGIPRHVIQGIVGHGSPAMTEHYSHDSESAKAILKLKII